MQNTRLISAGQQRYDVKAKEDTLIITKRTNISDILDRYADIAPAMEALGIQSVGSLGVRRKLARFINVAMAARIHRVPVGELINKRNTAVAQQTHEARI